MLLSLKKLLKLAKFPSSQSLIRKSLKDEKEFARKNVENYLSPEESCVLATNQN